MNKHSNKKSLWTRFRERYGNPMDWSSLDRSLLLASLHLFVLISFGISIFFYKSHFLSDYVNHKAIEVGKYMCLLAIAFYAGLLTAGLRAREKRDDWPLISHLLAQSFVITSTVSAYMPGMYTTTTSLVLVAGLALGVPLLDKRPIFFGFITCIVLLGFLVVGQAMEWIPYGPMFKRMPILPNGHPLLIWQIGQAIMIVCVTLVAWAVMKLLIDRWRERESLLAQLARTDELTGLPNRRHFVDALENECLRARRLNRPISLLMCDADHFKKVNDTYGHSRGDEVLVRIAQVLEEELRGGTDMAGRLGGEEFAAFLSETDLAGAEQVAIRIAQHMRRIEFLHNEIPFRVTLSIGVTALPGIQADPDVLLEGADALLYRAKRGGRDKVVAARIEDLKG